MKSICAPDRTTGEIVGRTAASGLVYSAAGRLSLNCGVPVLAGVEELTGRMWLLLFG